MTGKRWLPPLVLALGFALLLGGFAFTQRSRAAAPASSPEALAREVEALRGEVVRLRADAQPKIFVVPGAAPAAEPVAAEVTEKPQPSALTAEERNAQSAADLGARFESEPIDAAWSTATEREIRDTLASSVPAARLIKADCATSLCRVVLAHDSEADQQAIAHHLGAAQPFQEGVFYDYQRAPGALQTTLYVLRPGYSFQD